MIAIMNQVKVAILFLLFIILFSCTSSKKEIIVNERPFHWEGWAGNPDNPEGKPYDYFYMRHTARASRKAIDKKDNDLMQKTCIEGALLQSKGSLLLKMISDSQPAVICSANEGYIFPASIIYEKFSKNFKEIKTKDCKPVTKGNPDLWEECECIVYINILSGKETINKRIDEWEQTGL